MDQSQALKEAMDDVTTLAEQLRMLQNKMKDNESASKNLTEVCDTLTQLGNTIGNIHVAFSELLNDAKGVSKKANAVTKSMKAGEEVIKNLTSETRKVRKTIDDVSEEVAALRNTTDQLAGTVNTGKNLLLVLV